MIPKQASVWDQSRNSSFVIPPTSDALPQALAALERLRQEDPALVAWIEEGHPNLTEEEHLERFRVPYKKKRRK